MLSKPDGKPRGTAFVKFSSKNALNKALQLNASEHMGRTLIIEQAQGAPQQQRNNNMQNGNRNGGFRGNQQQDEAI